MRFIHCFLGSLLALAALPAQAQQPDFKLRMFGLTGISGNINQPIRKIVARDGLTLALLADSTVVVWGRASNSMRAVPIDLSGVVDIMAGRDHVLALKTNGTLVAWGSNANGQCNLPNGLGRSVAIASGALHSLTLKADSTVVAWGDNSKGQCTIPTGLSGVVAIAAGDYHNLALKKDGSLVAWGDTSLGKCKVPTGLLGIVAVTAGSNHSLALKADGTVVGWGRNHFGQCTIPVGLDSVVSIAGGVGHSLALKGDSTVVAWGDNQFYQCDIPAGLTGVVAISASFWHSLALKADGTMVGWGGSQYGECTVPAGFSDLRAITAGNNNILLALKADSTVVVWGDNTKGQSTVPRGLRGVVAIAAGGYHCLVLKGDSTVVAWGNNSYGQCTIPAGLKGVVAIAAGNTHSLALKSDGSVVAWGDNTQGQCSIPTGLRGVLAVSAGFDHSLALRANGTVVAWGINTRGQCTQPPNLSNVVAVTGGFSHNLALKADGTVVAWGDGALYFDLPVGLSGVVAIDCGNFVSIAMKSDGTVTSTGHNQTGQVSGTERLSGVSAITAGDFFSAVLLGPIPFQAMPHRLQGQVFAAGNGDCVRNPGEETIAFQPIQARTTAGGKSFYTFSDTLGRFNLGVDSGAYTVAALLPQDPTLLQRQVCPANNLGYTANFAGTRDTVAGLNFAIDQRACPRLEVSVASNRRRRCAVNQTILRYANSGHASQPGVVAHLKLPRYVVLLTASVPYTFSVPDSVYHFQVGTLAPGQSGQILILDSVVCLPRLMRLEQCTRVWLTPGIARCQWPAGYDGSVVKVRGACVNSGVSFILRNLGQGMSVARRVRVYADSLLVYQNTYQLSAGDSITYGFPRAGVTAGLTLVAEQDSLSPAGLWETGFASCARFAAPASQSYLPPPTSPVEARDCQPIRDSYDPNDKQVQPKGITRAGNVEPGTWLSYRIRFMNKGNDTAYTVRIVDTLNAHLDLASLTFGAASHRYVPKLSGVGQPVLTFEMRNIMLPDSTRSGTAASSGFIDFRLRTLEASPLGTAIRNWADIYFDFNDPIRTNTVLNTLYRPTVTPGVVDTVTVLVTQTRQAKVANAFTVQPNPGTGQVTLTATKAGTLTLYSTDGKGTSFPVQQGSNTLQLGHLPRGLYVLRLQGQTVRWVRE